ncbi:DNA mismatch repair protein [Bryobacterales bacterium F-183]|nr:DNA mismatch repair protein [Bryobacterales bacterium F-183]
MATPLTSNTSPQQQYEARLAHWRTVLQAEDKRYGQFSDFRMWTVIAGLGLAWWDLPYAGIAAAVFFVLMVMHSRIDERRIAARRGIAYFERGLARLQGKWAGSGPTGDRFLDSNHVFAADLDLFGRGSLFQLISTARTAAGEDVLASWLLHPASRDDVKDRQTAVRELAPQVDLRETTALTGDDIHANWRLSPVEPFPTWAIPTSWTITAASLTAAIGWIAGLWTSAPLLSVALIALLVTWVLRRQILDGMSALDSSSRELDLLVRLLHHLEERNVQSPLLQRLRSTVSGSSKQVAYLKKLVTLSDAGRNQYLMPVMIPLLWNVHVANAMYRWQQTHAADVDAWMRALAEFEALCSLSCYAFENPTHAYPELVAEPVFDATELGHPLLAADHCVRNNVDFGGPTRLVIVSGSNMSGKSTMLRSIGLNVVLAWAGCSVRATSLKLGRFAVGASLRTADSIQDGKSRFYAEITRLKQITDLTTGPIPVLFLLDELLSGTNSHDRRIGAQGILKALVDRGAIGLVTTHDLALASIADVAEGTIRNVHFEDHVEGGEIRFDYKMRPGVVTRSNALELMRAVGLLPAAPTSPARPHLADPE